METLKERMQKYEKELDKKLDSSKYTIIRLDGKGFSKLKKKWNLKLPFDDCFHEAMNNAADYLLHNIENTKIVWTGSDEISVLITPVSTEDNSWFQSRIFKWCSLAASYTSVMFNNSIIKYHFKTDYFDILKYPAFFDAKIFQFPSIEEACNNIIYRQQDLVRNSISEYAQKYFSAKTLIKKNSDQKINMMRDEYNFDYLTESVDWSRFGILLYKVNKIYDKNTKKEINSDNFDENIHYMRTKTEQMCSHLTVNMILEKINLHENFTRN